MTNESDSYDLIIVGAGINGAAIAREAALSGLSVLIVEQDDIASGTSATSTRLIHGGLRYLEYAELSLVFESLAERERLLRLAPHLVEPLGLYLPIYAGAKRKPWQIRAGMWLYDLLSMHKSLPRHRMLSRRALLERLPALRAGGLEGGAFYYDAQIRFPERLTVENLVDARRHGATVMTHTRVTRIVCEAGRVQGVEWRDRDGQRGAAVARAVINAAGPWVDRVLGTIASAPLIGGTKGSHVVVAPFRGAPGAAIYAEAGSDGRPFFVLPWNDLYLIGTTDERFEGDPGAAEIDPREFSYLIAETESLLPGASGLADRVLYTQSGIRPLPRVTGGSTSAITRRHIIHAHRAAEGLLSVIGGKLTTHRALAEDAMRALRRAFPSLPRRSPTRQRLLPGALEPESAAQFRRSLQERFGTTQADRLWHVYGARAQNIVGRIDAASELGQSLGPDSRLLLAEIVHALDNEWALTLVDLLQRRTMSGFERDFGLHTAPAVADALARLGIWDRACAEENLDAYRSYARRHGPQPRTARTG
jgi:glycerol-3-phosphate dehydrogenase